MSKQVTCWYCHLHGESICDEWGCCKRCGTNLKKWSSRDKLIYPSLSDERLAQEVLGTRERCDIPPDGEAEASQASPIGEKHAGKVNHCKNCWQKTIVFIWSTSRVIDKEKLGQLDQFKNVINLERLGYPICWACIRKHNLIIGTEEAENEA